MRHHLPLVLAAAALVLPAAARDPASPPARIRAEIAALASAVEADGGAELAYVSTTSSLNFIRGRAWFLTLAVADAPAYGGTYFVLSEIDGRLTGELLHAPGGDGTRVFAGDELTGYLLGVELDAAPIRSAFERHARARPR